MHAFFLASHLKQANIKYQNVQNFTKNIQTPPKKKSHPRMNKVAAKNAEDPLRPPSKKKTNAEENPHLGPAGKCPEGLDFGPCPESTANLRFQKTPGNLKGCFNGTP